MTLNKKITFYVPSTMNGTESIDNSLQVEHVADMLCQLCGGATSIPVNGYYKMETGEIVKENTVQVFAYTSFWNLRKIRKNIQELANWIKLEMMQESVALEINGKMEFF